MKKRSSFKRGQSLNLGKELVSVSVIAADDDFLSKLDRFGLPDSNELDSQGAATPCSIKTNGSSGSPVSNAFQAAALHANQKMAKKQVRKITKKRAQQRLKKLNSQKFDTKFIDILKSNQNKLQKRDKSRSSLKSMQSRNYANLKQFVKIREQKMRKQDFQDIFFV